MGSTSTQDDGEWSFWDGSKRHFHNPNTVEDGYQCAICDHYWFIVRKHPCPEKTCNFGKEEESGEVPSTEES